MRHVLFLIIILGAVPAGCAASGGGPAFTGVTPRQTVAAAGSPTVGRARVDSSMLAAVNQARSRARKCGSAFHAAVPPVVWNARMGKTALKHSVDMSSNGFLSHTGSDASSTDERLAREGYSWRAVGENIAVGQSTVAEVVRGWLSSEGHCRNIMSPDFHEIGAAYAFGPYQGSPSVKYWTLVLGSAR